MALAVLPRSCNMALVALLQQGFGAKLTIHSPGQPLVELQGSPAKVNQVTLENSELLLTALIPGYVQGVPMRINNFERAMHQLDDLHGNLLSGGNGQWHETEALKISMLLGYALRGCKRKGHSHCYSTSRLRRLWERCTDKHGLPTEDSQDHEDSLGSVEDGDLLPTSPLMTLPGFPHSEGESECGTDAGAAPDAAVQVISSASDTEPQSVANREPVGGPTVQTNLAYKRCHLVVPDSAVVESPPVIDHQAVKAIRREIRKQKKQGVIKRPAADPSSIIKRPAADPSSRIKRPAADPAASVTPKAAKRDSGLNESQLETYMGRPILEVAADLDPYTPGIYRYEENAGHDTDVKFSWQRKKPIWQVIRNKEILVQTTVGKKSWHRADEAGAAAYTLRLLSVQGHDKATLTQAKVDLLRMSSGPGDLPPA